MKKSLTKIIIAGLIALTMASPAFAAKKKKDAKQILTFCLLLVLEKSTLVLISLKRVKKEERIIFSVTNLITPSSLTLLS